MSKKIQLAKQGGAMNFKQPKYPAFDISHYSKRDAKEAKQAAKGERFNISSLKADVYEGPTTTAHLVS